MKKTNEFGPHFSQITNQLLNSSLIIFGFMSIIALVIGTMRIRYSGWSWMYLPQNLIMIMVIFAAFYRKKLSGQVKVTFLILGLSIIFLGGMYHFGFLASGKVLILVVPILSSFAFSTRTSVIILVFFALTYFIYCYLWLHGILRYEFNVEEYVTHFNSWIVDALDLVILSLGVLLTMHVFANSIKKQFVELELSTQQRLATESNYRQIFESTNNGILLCNLDRQIISSNPMAQTMLLRSTDELNSLSLSSLNMTDTVTEINNNFDSVIVSGNKTACYEWPLYKSNGVAFWVSATLIKASFSGSEKIMIIFTDITEKRNTQLQLEQYQTQLEAMVAERTRQLQAANEDLIKQKLALETTLETLNQTQAQLIQTEKMASLGVLTAGVAHEINNSLNFIQSGIYAIETSLDKEHIQAQSDDVKSKIVTVIDRMKKGMKQVNNIVSGLNQFSHTSQRTDEICNIHTIIEDCLLILNHKLKHIDLHKNFTSQTAIIKGNEGKLHQVFMNILVNAIQATDEEGTITINTVIQNNWLQIEICDNGTGMSPEVMSKIFDPFFTTKSAGKGTGLGLSIVYGIVTEHNGIIDYISELGAGTKALVLLPLNQRA